MAGPILSQLEPMSSKRKEYKVDARTKKAALFFLACETNPATRLSIPEAMRAKGYTDDKAADRILVQQVRRESQKNKSNDSNRQEAIAAATTHGAKFFVTGGKHVTSNDMFKVAEINRRKLEAAEREKEKKSRVEYHARREAALPIINRLQNDLWEMISGGLKARSWRFCSSGRVCPCQRWGTLLTVASSTNNLQRELRRR